MVGMFIPEKPVNATNPQINLVFLCTSTCCLYSSITFQMPCLGFSHVGVGTITLYFFFILRESASSIYEEFSQCTNSPKLTHKPNPNSQCSSPFKWFTHLSTSMFPRWNSYCFFHKIGPLSRPSFNK